MQGLMLAITAIMTAMIIARVTVLPKASSAPSRRPWPSLKAAKALPPLPTSIAKAMKTMAMGNAAVVTARPSSPTAWPRKAADMTL